MHVLHFLARARVSCLIMVLFLEWTKDEKQV